MTRLCTNCVHCEPLSLYIGPSFLSVKRLSSRYHFTEHEKLLLETVFTHTPRPNGIKIQELAQKLAVSAFKVYNWFSSKRSLSKPRTTPARCLNRKLQASYMI